MRGSLRLGRIAGIEIGINYTWLFAFLLITWSLAAGFFPQSYAGWNTATYWVTGVVAALLLFVSVLVHEMAHSLVARARGLPVRSITLFIFGGVSNIGEEPEKPKVEFYMAAVGPLTSLVLAGIFWGLVQVVGDKGSPLAATLYYLALINAVLAGFNLIPGFPLDGGRMLRSVLWWTTGSLTRATNIAAITGRIIAWGLIGFGVYQLFQGNFLGGLWIAFIGWFLSSAAGAGRREVSMRESLRGIKVRDVMDPSLECASPQTSIGAVVQGIFVQRGRRAVPVCQDDELVGMVTLTDIKGVPQPEWAHRPVGEIMTRQPLYTVEGDDDLNSALRLLAEHGLDQVPVLSKGRLVGLLSRAHVISYLRLSQELGIRSKQGSSP